MYYDEDTIAAISTGTASNSGIGIIRISGPDAIRIADKIFVSKKNIKLSQAATHTIHYGNIADENGIIDEVLVSVMKAPNTYTRENIVEINSHGGIVVMNKILEACFKNGIRPAEPGEFTKRAFLNGRMDLSQAEAVIDIINSKNEMALKSSVNQLNGYLSGRIKLIRDEIINDTAFIEAALDDPEHISLDNFSQELELKLEKICGELEYLIKTSDNGRLIKEGINTVILGKPNAGKSSLLNILARADKAIVTDIPGTTRDIIEEQINLNGVILRLIDTAGIRDTMDTVEAIGVDKALECAKNADLIIYVVDSSVPLDENDAKIKDIISKKNVVILLNKSDLKTVVSKEAFKEFENSSVIDFSAKSMEGFELLEETIEKMFLTGKIEMNDELIIANQRQKNSLNAALSSLKLVQNSIAAGMPEDFYTIDLMNAYEELGKITGESVDEDLANEIFSKFCMGK
jgi:tRNA modification GTPase